MTTNTQTPTSLKISIHSIHYSVTVKPKRKKTKKVEYLAAQTPMEALIEAAKKHGPGAKVTNIRIDSDCPATIVLKVG